MLACAGFMLACAGFMLAGAGFMLAGAGFMLACGSGGRCRGQGLLRDFVLQQQAAARTVGHRCQDAGNASEADRKGDGDAAAREEMKRGPEGPLNLRMIGC